MGISTNDISYIDANGNRITVGTATPLPVTGGGGGGGTATSVSINDGAGNTIASSNTVPTGTERGLLVRTVPSGLPTNINLTQVLGAALSASNPVLSQITQPLPAGSNDIGRVRISDGAASGRMANVTAASTAAVATDTSLVVQLSPNTPLGQNALPIYNKGAYATTTDAMAQALNSVTTTLAAIDARDFQSVSIQLTFPTAFTGSLAFEVSNDATNWTGKALIREDNGSFSATVGVSAQANSLMFQGDVGARYFRVRTSAYTSGSVTVIALLDSLSTATIPQQSIAVNNTVTTASVAAAETGSLAALNAVAGGVTDLSTYGQVQVQVTGTWVATLTFQVSIDGTNWVSKNLISATLGASTAVMGSNGLYFGHIGARYFRVIATAYTSGTAVVTIRYNAAAGEMPMGVVRLGADGNGDGRAGTAADSVVLAAWNGSTIDRLYNGASVPANGQKALLVASGMTPTTPLSAATGPANGASTDNTTARAAHTIQVDVTTTTVGTAGTHTVVLEGSLDGANWTTLATVTPAATSTTATDPTNHANASVSGYPYRYVRARWASIPTSWVGTLTARVASA